MQKRDRAEARSKARSIGAVLRSTRPVQSSACYRRTGARGSLAMSNV